MDRFQLAVNKRRDAAMIFDVSRDPVRVLGVSNAPTLAYKVCVEMNRQEAEEIHELAEVCDDCGAEIHRLRPGLCLNCKGVGR